MPTENDENPPGTFAGTHMRRTAKSFLLKLADPFFKKRGAGASLPIKITGSRSHTSFGLDLHRKSDHP